MASLETQADSEETKSENMSQDSNSHKLTTATRSVSTSVASTNSNACMKQVSLVTLTVQNTLSILLLRYVRTLPGPRFINSTAIVTSEIQKSILSILLLINEERTVTGAFKEMYNKILCQPYDTFKTGIPALLYTLVNNLLFVALSNLDAATFQVTYQLKIFTTAILSVVILRRRIVSVQWFALILLFGGVSLVQLENMSAAKPKQDVNPVYGFVAILVACTLSGLAGVYFEKILKGSDVSVWIRNIQLGVLSTIFGIATMYASDGAEVHEKGFLYGYTTLAWTAIFLHGIGGLVVALVVKYADVILKGFATSLAIVLSCIISIMLFDFQLTFLFTLGAALVIFSIFLYSKPELISNIPILNMFFRL